MPRVGPARDAWAVQDNSLKAPWTFRAKEKIQCLCEGGRWCTREDPARQRGGNAIPGLHCSWVGDKQNVLAMARPSQDKIVKMAMVDAFLKHNIGMILNLQEVGEHDSCGPGNLKHSGFSYDPESFMTARIGVYNFSWKDMGVPDLNKIMDIVQVMDYVTGSEGRKIAVHCHAGLGRTGLAIACHFLYSLGYSARKAIETVRRDRQGSIQTREQQLFVYVFEQYLAHLRCLFDPLGIGPDSSPWGPCSPPPSGPFPTPSTPAPRLPATQHSAATPSLMTPISIQPTPGPKLDGQQPPMTPSWQASAPGGTHPHTPTQLVANSFAAAPVAVAGAGPSTKAELGSGPGVVAVKESNGVVTELHACGLTVVRPTRASGPAGVQAGASTAAAAGEAAGAPGSTTGEQGSSRGVPWDAALNILPSQYTKDWLPHPPNTYAESLHRQQRLLHGPDRRSYLHLHRFVKEAVFAVIAAAQEHSHHAQAQAGQHTQAPLQPPLPQTWPQIAPLATQQQQQHAQQVLPLQGAQHPQQTVVHSKQPSQQQQPYQQQLYQPAQQQVMHCAYNTPAAPHSPARQPLGESLEPEHPAPLWQPTAWLQPEPPGCTPQPSLAARPVHLISGPGSSRRRQQLPKGAARQQWWLSGPQGQPEQPCQGGALSPTLHRSHASPCQSDLEHGTQLRCPADATLLQLQAQTAALHRLHLHQASPPQQQQQHAPPLQQWQQGDELGWSQVGCLPARQQQRTPGCTLPTTPGPICEGLQPSLAPSPAAPALHGQQLVTEAPGWGCQAASGPLPPPGMVQSFAHAVACCVAGAQLDPGMATLLAAHPGYAGFVTTQDGKQGPATLQASLIRLQQAVNYGNLTALASAPLAVVLAALTAFFSSFSAPSLSESCLAHIASVYHQLPFDQEPASEQQQLGRALEQVQALAAPDQELLLLFSALLRHVIEASGGEGCQPHILLIAKWVLSLLLGSGLAAEPAAEEAMLSYLWYCVRNDVAYTALIVAKTQRIERRPGPQLAKLTTQNATLGTSQPSAWPYPTPAPLTLLPGALASPVHSPTAPARARARISSPSLAAAMASLPSMPPRLAPSLPSQEVASQGTADAATESISHLYRQPDTTPGLAPAASTQLPTPSAALMAPPLSVSHLNQVPAGQVPLSSQPPLPASLLSSLLAVPPATLPLASSPMLQPVDAKNNAAGAAAPGGASVGHAPGHPASVSMAGLPPSNLATSDQGQVACSPGLPSMPALRLPPLRGNLPPLTAQRQQAGGSVSQQVVVHDVWI